MATAASRPDYDSENALSKAKAFEAFMASGSIRTLNGSEKSDSNIELFPELPTRKDERKTKSRFGLQDMHQRVQTSKRTYRDVNCVVR